MKFIILCGGIGKRNNNYSLPKPLNYINGRHMIEYIIENIPSNEIYIIYNIFLDKYHFKEIIVNKCKHKQLFFSCVDYLTRGAVETAYIGLSNFTNIISEEENIVFIDNDNLHSFPNTFTHFDHDFIGYSIDYVNTNYSFIVLNESNKIINIAEKDKISDHYCCGLYGFKNSYSFLNSAKEMLYSNNKTKNEFYFSQLYKLKILQNTSIESCYIDNTKHLGTYDEIIKGYNHIHTKKLRICFDLDNTLVTYPSIPGNYTTVKPIIRNIQLLNKLKKEGHEIIIYTARRMQTHGSNVGKVIKDIALTTINTLENLNIPYDELIFGKPIADIYIDDRAINPYINNDLSFFGLFTNQLDEEYIYNKVNPNKYNTIERFNKIIYKTGPCQFIQGELYFYQNIPNLFVDYFPKLLHHQLKNDMNNTIQLHIDFIDGLPLYYLYKNKLVTYKIIDDLLNILNTFHSYQKHPYNITEEDIKSNYFDKLKKRFENKIDYDFDDAEIVFHDILNGLNEHYSPEIVSFIHGDFWFSNILMTYDDQYKCIDMKGQVNNILTTNGDKYYDYGKLFQSIMGFDLYLNNNQPDNEYINHMKEYFLEKCVSIGLHIPYLKYVTKSLIFGTFHSIDTNNVNCKKNIWNLIKTIT
jgi:capsule biosynthesis phosphatase